MPKTFDKRSLSERSKQRPTKEPSHHYYTSVHFDIISFFKTAFFNLFIVCSKDAIILAAITLHKFAVMISNFTRNSSIIDIDKNIDISCQSSRNQSEKKKKKRRIIIQENNIYISRDSINLSIVKDFMGSLKRMKIIRKNLE